MVSQPKPIPKIGDNRQRPRQIPTAENALHRTRPHLKTGDHAARQGPEWHSHHSAARAWLTDTASAHASARRSSASRRHTSPAAPTAAIGDDLYLRHKHVLRRMPEPPRLCPSVRSKRGPVQRVTPQRGLRHAIGVACARPQLYPFNRHVIPGLERVLLAIQDDKDFALSEEVVRRLLPVPATEYADCISRSSPD